MPTKALKEMTIDELREYAGGLRSEFAGLSEKTRTDEENTRVRAIAAEAEQLDTHLTLALIQQQREELSRLRTLGVGPVGAMLPVSEGFRSGGQMWVESDSFKAWAGSGYGGEGFRTVIDGGIAAFEAGQRAPSYIAQDFGSGGPGNASDGNLNALLPVGQPIAPTPRQAKMYLRDLMPVMTTALTTIPYVQELDPTANELAATAVPEGGPKPDVSLNFQGQNASPTVIAADLTMSKQLFEDASVVVQYINQRLPYLVKFREDNEFLNGSGAWPRIRGILNTTGTQTQAATAGESAITIANAIEKIELVDGAATAVVMYPTDAWAMFTKRAAGGSGTFDAGTPFANIPLTVWGLPTYRTRLMTSGHSLVGDYQRGATVIDRQQVTIETFTQHADYAQLNQLLLRCEERVGLMVQRPDLFVDTTLS